MSPWMEGGHHHQSHQAPHPAEGCLPGWKVLTHCHCQTWTQGPVPQACLCARPPHRFLSTRCSGSLLEGEGNEENEAQPRVLGTPAPALASPPQICSTCARFLWLYWFVGVTGAWGSLVHGSQWYGGVTGTWESLTLAVLAAGTASTIGVRGKLVVGWRLGAVGVWRWILVGEGRQQGPGSSSRQGSQGILV